jgi:type I restriction enzyme S subunit
MNKYPLYKDIGLPWLREIPEHWDIVRNKNIFFESNDRVGERSSEYTLLSLTLNGIIPRDVTSCKGKFPKDFDTYKVVTKGDMAFCLFDIDETPRTVGLSQFDGMLTGAYSIFHVANINPSYAYYYYLALDNFKALKPLYKGLRKTISSETFMGIKFPAPSVDEQNQIVRYLDWQTSRINKLINAKKKQIALLEEQKQGIVNAVVLGGASDNQKRKDSGVAWIGQIPDHWDAVRCKYLFTEINDRSEEGLETHLSMSQKYGLVPDSMLDERRMLSASYAGGKLCQKGDLVLNRLKAHLGVFALAPMEGVISPDYTVLRPNREYILPEFAEAVLKCTKCRPELRIRVRGIVEGFWRLYTDDFNTIYIPLPPIEEQRSIMQAIAAKQEHLNKLIKAINQEIELLQEYRTRLISDVVTGQVDVRDVAIPEYEAVQELAEEEDDAFEDETEMEDGE